MAKYLFFDLDKTLIDLEHAEDIAGEKMWKHFGFDKVVELEPFLQKWKDLTNFHYEKYTKKEISYSEQRTRRITDLFDAFKIALEGEPLDTFAFYLTLFEENWVIFDDVLPVLETLSKTDYVLGVISNGDLAQQTQKLENTGIIKFFKFVTTSSEYSVSKPDTRLFEMVFNRFNISKEDFCYVGDSLEKDVLPCLKLGSKAIWVNRKNKTLPENSPEVTQISSLSDILNHI